MGILTLMHNGTHTLGVATRKKASSPDQRTTPPSTKMQKLHVRFQHVHDVVLEAITTTTCASLFHGLADDIFNLSCSCERCCQTASIFVTRFEHFAGIATT